MKTEILQFAKSISKNLNIDFIKIYEALFLLQIVESSDTVQEIELLAKKHINTFDGMKLYHDYRQLVWNDPKVQAKVKNLKEVEFHGQILEVDYDYNESDPSSGAPADLTINSISYNGTKMDDFFNEVPGLYDELMDVLYDIEEENQKKIMRR